MLCDLEEISSFIDAVIGAEWDNEAVPIRADDVDAVIHLTNCRVLFQGMAPERCPIVVLMPPTSAVSARGFGLKRICGQVTSATIAAIPIGSVPAMSAISN
jgi:hypothetical protein